MPLQEDITKLLKAHDIQPNTDFGQHFLISEKALTAIIEAANLQESDTVVEIGAGPGILTKELLKRAKKVISIEVDSRWEPIARTYIGEELAQNLTFIRGDALQQDFPETPYKIVSNLPYQITSPLIRHALQESKQLPDALTLLIQKEVAEKICALSQKSLLSVLVELYGEASLIRNVPPGAFLPPPKVDSAVIHIQTYAIPLASQEIIRKALKFASTAFSQKRKMLRGTIGKIQGGEELLKRASIAGDRRPATLTKEEWISLAENIEEN